MSIVDILVNFHEAFARGLRVTLELSAITWGFGLTVGSALGIIAHRWHLTFGRTLRGTSFLLSSVPFLVLLYWAHYPLQEMMGVVIDPFVTASVLLAALNSVAVAEICRRALDDFPREYVLAARACGLTPHQTVAKIQFPLVLRQVIPPLLTQQVVMLQTTLFASLISVEELFRVSQRINSSIHKPVEIYTALALFFVIVCAPLNGLAIWLRTRYTRNISER